MRIQEDFRVKPQRTVLAIIQFPVVRMAVLTFISTQLDSRDIHSNYFITLIVYLNKYDIFQVETQTHPGITPETLPLYLFWSFV